MIYSTSRYANGVKGQMADRHSTNYTTYVHRVMPSTANIKFYLYTFVEGDRLDVIAGRFLGDENRWWEIMDYNPEVHDPLHIAPGTVLRIPSA